jgi:putative ABC transport system permease protein
MGGGDGDGTWMVDRRIFVSNATFVREIEPAATYDEISLWSRTSPASGAPDVKAIAGRLSPLLVNLHHGVKDFEFDALARGADIEGLIDVALTVALLGCGLVASLVGAVNVMNAQLVAVAERTRELGIRRALGASSRRLRASVLLETILLAGVASVLGTTVGVALAKGASALLTAIVTPWPFEIVGWAVWVAVGGAVASGALAGWLPAERAASLDVAACLRAS